MIYPPPGVCPRCGAKTKPYALYRAGVAPLANPGDPMQEFPWGCLLYPAFQLLDWVGLQINFGGMAERRAVARAREKQFEQNDLTMVCTRCTWTEMGETPPLA